MASVRRLTWRSCLILIVLIGVSGISGLARADSPYNTWVLGPGGAVYPSQDAYTPLDQIDLPVSGPEDLFLAPDGALYVADTGNRRIIKLDAAFQVVQEFGAGLLQSPTGLYVDEDGTLYIADAGSNTVVILNAAGELVNQFGRPTEPLFGADRQFLPRKIALDPRGNLYIISEGSIDGLAMMNADGSFIGYFGANSAALSLRALLQRLFLTEEQLDQFIRNEAASPTNVTIDDQSLVYTITAGTSRDRSLRKFTVAGNNLFEDVFGPPTPRDIHVSADGLMTTISADGRITEFDANGTFLFIFGGLDRGDQRLGLLSDPTAIERVGDDLYVLDKAKNAIVTYRVTDFARRVHDGVRLYMEGYYSQAKPYFEEVLTFNGLVVMAYQAIADAEFNTSNYPRALEFYRYAEDREGYSDAFWELRNAVLQQSLGGALGVLLGGWVLLGVFTRLERRQGWLEPLRRGWRSLQNIRLVADFVFLFRFIRQPADSFYYIKQNQRGSLTFALLLYLWVLISRLAVIYLTGFVFNPFSATWQIDVEMEIAYVIGLIVLWNAANYMVATISDGEGSLRHVIIGSAYSLFPVVLFSLPITLLSNLLTLNEVFLFNFATQLMVFWCGLMLVIMVKEIHNYTLSETIKNLLATLFTMAMFLLTAYILYVLFNQLYEFILAIIREVGLRG